MRRLAALAALLLVSASDPPAWTEPTPPFHVVGPIWYVGTRGLAAWLIRTPAGAILLDGTMAENVAAIERSLAAAGAPIGTVKVLLNSHAHFDHAAGLARLKADSGARLAAMDADVPALESGTPPSVTSYGVIRFPPVKVDRVLHDGDTVRLGGVTLTALKTAGHTPGCTTWTTTVPDHGRPLRVVFPCSLTVAGNRLVGNAGYPGIVADYRASFRRLATVPAGVVLTAHPEIADVFGHRDRGRWVDPALLGRLVGQARTDFETELAKAGAHQPLVHRSMGGQHGTG